MSEAQPFCACPAGYKVCTCGHDIIDNAEMRAFAALVRRLRYGAAPGEPELSEDEWTRIANRENWPPGSRAQVPFGLRREWEEARNRFNDVGERLEQAERACSLARTLAWCEWERLRGATRGKETP